MLQRLGCQVDIACDGKEGVERAIENEYDLIVMDCEMPRMDGLEATRRLRAADCTVPIFAITANAMAGDLERCLDAGMNVHLTKPLDPKSLTDAMQRWGIRFTSRKPAVSPGTKKAPAAGHRR
jgi:CheY-like chemotaxis protein